MGRQIKSWFLGYEDPVSGILWIFFFVLFLPGGSVGRRFSRLLIEVTSAFPPFTLQTARKRKKNLSFAKEIFRLILNKTRPSPVAPYISIHIFFYSTLVNILHVFFFPELGTQRDKTDFKKIK